MTKRQRSLAWAGLLLGLVLCTLYGDPCRYSPLGPNWDAELQRCVP